MKTQQHHVIGSGLFTSIILFLFLGSSYNAFSQVVSGQPITTTQDWVVPAGVTSVTVECWGAGGGGGSSQKNAAAGGGGGGAYSRSLNIVVVPNSTVNIQIGVGAPTSAKNGDGAAGGNTWFLTSGTVYAEGGTGGLSSSTGGTGGAGGNAANGIGNDATLSGGNGTDGTGVQGGDGGDGANGGAGGAGGNGINGNPGSPPGGAGGGAGDSNNLGGAGADGQVILTWTAATTPTTLTLSNPTTAVNAASICAPTTKVPIHAVNIAADGSSGTGELTNFTIITTGTYAVSDIDKFELWYNSTNDLATATVLSTKTPVTTAGTQTFPAFSVNIPAGATYYFWATMDVAPGAVIGRTLTVNGSTSTDMTTTLTKAGGPTTASGAQTLTAIPAAPTANDGSAATDTQITANWSASTGATSYRLDVSDVNTFTTFVAGYEDLGVGNVTTYNITGLTAETTYYYRIRAVNTCGTSGNSGPITYATTTAVTTPTTLTISNPLTPVTAATVCASSVKVPIHAVNISANGSTGSGTLTNFQIVTTGSYAVSDITNFKIWYNSTNDLATATVLSTKTPVTTAGTQTFPAFSVNIPAGATYYFWATMDVAPGAVIGRTLTVNGSASTDMTTTLTKAGGPTTASGAQTLTAIPAAPTANDGSAATDTQITANWSASTGATSYRLDVSDVNTFTTFVAGYEDLGVGNVTTYNITGLTAETTYYYRIRAVNTCGTSGNSGTITYATVTTAALPPTITLTDPNPLAVQGGNSTNLIYIATTNNPNEYSIVYDATALGQGFEDVTLALPPSPITLSVPPTALLGTYNGILTVKNSITGLTSVNYPITITITDVTNHSLYNCTSCHITHNAPGSSLTAVSGNALLCQSCHISTGAASNKPLVNANNIALYPSTGNSHAWDVLAVNNTKETVRPPIGSEMELRVIDNQIICSTCHNQHNNGNAGNPYLRIDNTNDAMCKVCHAARNVGLYTDPTPGKGSHPVGVTYDDTDTRFNNTQTLVTNGSMVQCSTCHGVHDVDNSLGLAVNGNLLRATNDVSLCTDCHVPMLHNGMDCLDCHQVHNTDKSNLYMIKSTITTPGSGDKNVVFTSLTGANNFADGDGIDGVCEVCHQTTKHFRNSDNLAGAPDQLHTSQGLNISDQNCTTCHEHGKSFAGGDCVTCHQDNTTYPYLTGNWNISDGHVAHTTKYSFDCSTCHFNRGSGSNPDTHIDGTVDINFNATGLAKRNGNDTNTPSWNGTTCSSIYCHSNGKTADRGQDGTHFWGDGTAGGGIPFRGDALSYSTTPNWNSNGSITACTSCHGGPDALPPGPTYDITAGGIYDSNSTAEMPSTGSHGPLQSQHASGNMNDWGGGTTQCFWCHDTDDRTADFAGAVKKQGTYGTSLHVDGQTHFKMGWTTQGGTGNVDVPRMEIPSAHCQSKTCWGG